MAFSFGFDSSKGGTNTSGFSAQLGEQFSEGGSYFDPGQLAAQQQLQQAFFQQAPGIQGAPLVGAGATLGQIGNFQQGNNPFLGGNRFAAGIGQNLLGQFAQQQNPFINQQIGQYGEDIGRQFREQILPGIGSGFQQAGQRGSSRQGIAEGLAAQGALDQFSRGVTGLRSNAYNQQLGAASQLGQLGMQGALGAGQQGLGAIQQMAQLYPQIWQQRLSQQVLPFQIGAEIAGAPSALTFDRSYGYDTGYEEQTSKSKDKSGGFSFGF